VTEKDSQDSLLNQQQKAALYIQKCQQILSDAKRLLPSDQPKEMKRIESSNIVSPMFQLIWCGFLAVFAISFETSDDPVITSRCLSGLSYSLRIAARSYSEEGLSALISSLTKFTRLRTYSEKLVKPKNTLATSELLQIAIEERNYLRGTWSIIMEEVSAVDKTKSFPIPDILFTESNSLDRESIKDFVSAMCSTSKSELEETPPRTDMLVRLADVAHFNMKRPKFIWKEIWDILSDFLIHVGSGNEGKSDMVLKGSVNVLWQICCKFVEQPETSEYHFQEHFMRPFFEIFLMQEAPEIKGLIMECLEHVVAGFSATLRSGWSVIFQILSQASNDFRPKGFGLLSRIVARDVKKLSKVQLLHLISVVMAFVVKGDDEKLSLKAVDEFLIIGKGLGNDDGELWECLYASLEKSMCHNNVEVKRRVIRSGVDLLKLVKNRELFEKCKAVMERLLKGVKETKLVKEMKSRMAEMNVNE
jgi:Sec7-like guanine-nucleotide exchange factor